MYPKQINIEFMYGRLSLDRTSLVFENLPTQTYTGRTFHADIREDIPLGIHKNYGYPC